MGLSRDCTQDEIEKSYKKLALRYHPDRNPGDDEAASKFLEIQTAYDTLRDPSKRQAYDNPMSNFGFPFGNPFNMHTDAHEGEKLDINLVCNISLEDSVRGGVKTINYLRQICCQDCKGLGSANFKICPLCQGQGVLANNVGGFFRFQTMCGNCLGRGKIGTTKCVACSGMKVSKPQEASINLQIPQGVQSGMTLCIHNHGSIGADGRNGNVYIQIKIQEDQNYKLHGLDISCTYHAKLSTLIFGGKIEIPTLDNDVIEIDVPVGTKCATKFRIKEKGLPDFRNIQKRGDLIASVLVDVPDLKDNNLQSVLVAHGL